MTHDTHTHWVVVLSWFGRDDTLACVESVMAGDAAPVVLVVDNGSFDGVIEAVQERWPHVHTLQTGMNLGFAGGMNAGIARALDNGAHVVTVLNNDTVVPAGTLGRSRDLALEGYIVSPEVRYQAEPDQVWFGGGEIWPEYAFPTHIRTAALTDPEHGQRPSEYLAGCCVTASAEAWRDVGLFDDRFFLNFEDAEWSVRAARAGYPLIVDTESVLLHAVSASFERSASEMGTYYYVRNGLLFNRLYGGTRKARVAFVRHQGLHTIADRRRAGDRRGAWREARVVVRAIADHARRRYGPAPAGLQKAVAQWREETREK